MEQDRQRHTLGQSKMIKWLVTLGILGVVAVTGFQLVPVYMSNYAVKQIVQDVVADEELRSKPKRELLSKLKGRFIAQDLDHLDPGEIIKVARDNNGEWVLDVKYEERRKLMYNLEIVAGFDEQFTN
jgi:hypothetical protein